MKPRKNSSEGIKNLSVRLSESQRESLRAVSERTGIKEPEVIRHAVDMFLSRYDDEGPLAVGMPDRQRAGIMRRAAPKTVEHVEDEQAVIDVETVRRTLPARSSGKGETEHRTKGKGPA